VEDPRDGAGSPLRVSGMRERRSPCGFFDRQDQGHHRRDPRGPRRRRSAATLGSRRHLRPRRGVLRVRTIALSRSPSSRPKGRGMRGSCGSSPP